jgi:hypothetical protein
VDCKRRRNKKIREESRVEIKSLRFHTAGVRRSIRRAPIDGITQESAHTVGVLSEAAPENASGLTVPEVPGSRPRLLSAARAALRHLILTDFIPGYGWTDPEAADVATQLENAIEDVERGQ